MGNIIGNQNLAASTLWLYWRFSKTVLEFTRHTKY